MRRLSGPQSSGSPPGPSAQWGLSPVLQADPDPAAPPTPGALYRSCFAQECEAVFIQLSNAAEGARPCCPFSIQEETLTPLEPPCSFLESFDGRSTPRPVPETASASAGPPDAFAAVARGGEQSAGLAEFSPGVVAQPSAASPAAGLERVASWPAGENASPPPSAANVTYDYCSGSCSSGNATYVCPGSPSPEEKETSADAFSGQHALGVPTRGLPFVTSTPLLTPSFSKEASPITSGTDCTRKRAASGSASRQKAPAVLQQESGLRKAFVSSHRNLPPAASSGADRMSRVSSKAPFARNSLSLAAPRALKTRGAPGVGGLPKGAGSTRKIPQPAGGNCTQILDTPPSRSESALESQPVTQSLVPDETTRTDVMELPCNKKPPISLQPPSKLAGRFGVQGSLVCLGLKFHGTPRDNNVLGTRLPVFAGNKMTSKASSQKRPWEKPSDKATASSLKQPFPKRSRLCKSQKEKPTPMAAGQILSAAVGKELTAPCLQCQRLAEENQQLKSMLETCRKTIALLEGKFQQLVVEMKKTVANTSVCFLPSPGWTLEDVQRMELKPS